MPESSIPDELKRITLGIGTGRNGSETLSVLLNSQRNACFSHEFGLFAPSGERAPRYRSPLSWSGSLADARTAYDALRLYNGRYLGDIAMSWLPYLPDLCSRNPSIRIICIYRPKDDVINSFIKKTGPRNHWMAHNGVRWQADNLWDPVFPNFGASEKAEAIAMYWEHYRQKAIELRETFPDRVAIWPMAAMNDPNETVKILRHAGIADEDILNVHVPQRNKSPNRITDKLRKKFSRLLRHR